MQSEIIEILEIMNNMDDNIEQLNKCKYRGNKSDDNKKKTYRDDLHVQIKMEVSKQLSKFFLC